MAKVIKDEAPGEELKENEELSEGAEDETPSTEEEEAPVKAKKKSGKIKWIFIALIIILGISGLGTKYAPEYFSFLNLNKFETRGIRIDEDNLSEEVLSPFFIPPGPERDAIRIDLSIIWDGLASVRFKKKELVLRSMMSDKFNDIAEQNQDLNEKIPYLEKEVSSMLRDSMRVQNLEIKIKEIRYF